MAAREEISHICSFPGCDEYGPYGYGLVIGKGVRTWRCGAHRLADLEPRLAAPGELYSPPRQAALFDNSGVSASDSARGRRGDRR